MIFFVYEPETHAQCSLFRLTSASVCLFFPFYWLEYFGSALEESRDPEDNIE